MKTLILILYLANGEEGRNPMPAWECRQVQAAFEQALHVGGHMARDDGIQVISVDCVTPGIADVPSEGPCETEQIS